MTTGTRSSVSNLAGCNVLLGVTGSIAAFKVAGWVRSLVDEEALVKIVMTRAATEFVTALTFSALSGNRVYKQMFDEEPDQAMSHINLAREADFFLIAPATAHTIARLANGLADDLLTTTVLACTRPVIICPAMNCYMYDHKATQINITRLKALGYIVVDPAKGTLACGDEGAGRLPEWDVVREVILSQLCPQDLAGQKILITAGPTQEPLDPARYLSNRSSGKMGYALARTALRRGAQVTLVSGPVNLAPPAGVEYIPVKTSLEMHDAVMPIAGHYSIIVKAAAVADFRPQTYSDKKIKKQHADSDIKLVHNIDILKELGVQKNSDHFLVGFAAESNNHLEEGRRKLSQKNADMIVVNDILGEKTGFDSETNQVILLDRNESVTLPLLSKEDTANGIWDRVCHLRQ